MDYGRLFLFMAAAVFVMSLATHLWCWIYSAVERAVFRRKLVSMCQALGEECLEDDEVDRRRLLVPRYQTWEQAMADFRGGVPLDDVLDRLNGEFPPRASEIQKAGPAVPPTPESIQNSISGPVLATTLITLAVLTCFWGFDPNPKVIEELLKWARQRHGAPPPTSGAGA